MAAKKVTFADIAKYTNFFRQRSPDILIIPTLSLLKIRRRLPALWRSRRYQENKLAKVLANGKSEFVGIIIPNLTFTTTRRC